MKISTIILTIILFSVAMLTFAQQNTGVSAQALGQANLRADDDVNSDLVGEIANGTNYPVIGRSQFFPWILLGEPDTFAPKGWVYETLVAVNGNINVVPFSDVILNQPTPIPIATAVPNQADSSNPLPSPTVGASISITATPTITAFAVTGVITGEVNVRYGPGVEYPRVHVAYAGERYEITGYHTQFPWVRIAFSGVPNNQAWIAENLLEIEGNVFTTQAVTQARLALPTLSPTPSVISASGVAGQPAIPLSTGFQTLGNQLWGYVLDNGFDPETSRFGALFVMDLQTGEALTFGDDFAFSGTSVNKVAILAKLYDILETPPTVELATDIANTMICSENVATNRLLSTIGNGDEYLGSEAVTDLYNQLGSTRSFLTAPFTTIGTPEPPPRPVLIPETTANQEKANPDLTNQITVSEIGSLLANVYQCAYNDGATLPEPFGTSIEPRECRQLLHVMSNNTVDALLKAGVPANTRVAHKHGWIEETHGNAAVFFTPGGDYVIAMMMYQPTFLNFQESLPVIADVSRQVYNYFNPDQPQQIVRDGFIPETNTCNYAGDPLVGDLMQSIWTE
jgi:uncharacterized protein YraI